MTDALARLKTLVPQMRKARGTMAKLPPVATWRTLEGVASRPVVNRYGTVIVTRGIREAARTVPLLLDHEADLWLGWVTRLWSEGGALHFRAVVPPSGFDTLADQAWGMVTRAERPVLTSMATENHTTAGREVTGCDLVEISLLTGAAQGIEGCHVLKTYDDPAAVPRREMSPEAARFVAEGQRRSDEMAGRMWDAALAALGWRR